MHSNIDELSQFYQGKLGQLVINCISNRITNEWQNLENLDILGVGYTAPFLIPFYNATNRIINLIPEEMGLDKWSIIGPGQNVIAEESNLPFGDNSFDRVLCIHAIEGTLNPRKLLRELWRITKDEGTIVFFVTNRRSAWAQWDVTPFGHSRPYSKNQIIKLLDDAMFEIVAAKSLLTFPPFEIGLSKKNSERWEIVGNKLWPAIGGLTMVIAKKRLFSGGLVGKTNPRRKYANARASFLTNAK